MSDYITLITGAPVFEQWGQRYEDYWCRVTGGHGEQAEDSSQGHAAGQR